MQFLVLSLLSISLLMSVVSTTPISSGATIVGSYEPTTLIKGPSSRATVKGPSGPKIVTVGDTGAISSAPKTGGAVSAAGSSPGIVARPVPAIPAPVQAISTPELRSLVPGLPPVPRAVQIVPEAAVPYVTDGVDISSSQLILNSPQLGYAPDRFEQYNVPSYLQYNQYV